MFDKAAFQEEYQREGVVFPLTLFPPDEAAGLYEKYLAFQRAAVASRGRQSYIKPHLVSTWVDGIVHHPFVLDVVEAAIGPNILLWSSDFFTKAAGKATYVSWHQDTPFWNLDPVDNVVNVWLALTPSTVESGSMQVVRKTHKLRDIVAGYQDYSPDDCGVVAERDLLSRHQKLNYEVRPEEVTDVVLEPGQFSVHHGHIVHGGRPNRADFDRIGLVLRYISTDTRQLEREDSALLVRGEDAYGHFVQEVRPQADFDAVSLAVLEAALTRPSGFDDQTIV